VVGGVDSDIAATLLQGNGSINNKTFSTANTKVWMEESNPLAEIMEV
jgi:hypothetical protein